MVHAQEDDLEALLLQEMGTAQENVLGTFLSTFIINNQSAELLNKNGLNLRVSHKFGHLNSGSEHFYGFDDASVFTALEYAPLDWLNVGIGRATYRESVNGMVKVRLLRQTTGERAIPFSLVLLGELDYKTNKYVLETLQDNRSGRIDYTAQLLMARKFSKQLSLQVMPGYIHRNLVETAEDLNGILTVGVGGSYRLLKRLRFNAEYHWVQEHDNDEQQFYSPLSAGFCYQTSRHAFELFATNSTGITSNNHIAYTTGDFFKGDIAIGFNISIIFSTKR